MSRTLVFERWFLCRCREYTILLDLSQNEYVWLTDRYIGKKEKEEGRFAHYRCKLQEGKQQPQGKQDGNHIKNKLEAECFVFKMAARASRLRLQSCNFPARMILLLPLHIE